MRRHTNLLCSLLLGLTLALSGVQHAFAQTASQNTLPNRFGNWVSASPPIKVNPPEQDAALLSEAGLEEWITVPYASGSQTLHVSLERFHDPTGAYEAYTALLDTDLEPSTVGQLTAIGHGRLLMLIGNFLVNVEPQLASTGDLRELSGSVRKFADTTPLPPIRGFMPPGFVDGTQRYALGPVAFQAALDKLGESEFAPLAKEAGFNLSAEAMFASYQRTRENGVLL